MAALVERTSGNASAGPLPLQLLAQALHMHVSRNLPPASQPTVNVAFKRRGGGGCFSHPIICAAHLLQRGFERGLRAWRSSPLASPAMFPQSRDILLQAWRKTWAEAYALREAHEAIAAETVLI